ncbi:MAG: hypothetical protein J1F09_06420 [Oscillospiraceae bacterium]|nr:hypothetical protein [Oscillospiraceae bacterium]
MDITPIFELRNQLRSAAIAGANLISENFRLKKSVEAFEPLKGASPVFAKIYELSASLVSGNSESAAGTLLDTITLVDSVVCTLTSTAVPGTVEELPITEFSAEITNAPYSVLSAVIDALTTSGSGNYETVSRTRNERPELLRDYRVMPALVKGLGASYSELADLVENILGDMGEEIIPLLKKDFDPKGKKEMLRRLGLIERLCGASENAFYLEQLPNSEKDMRKLLIYALRFDPSNAEKLTELSKTEKGKAKDAALYALAALDCDISKDYFEELGNKKPEDTLKYLTGVTAPWVCRLTAKLLTTVTTDKDGNRIPLCEDKSAASKSKTPYDQYIATMKRFVYPLIGKSGAEIEAFYRDTKMPGDCTDIDIALGASIVMTNDEGLKKLAFELNKKYNGSFLGSETKARLYSSENCADWLEKQLKPIRKTLKNARDAYDNSIVSTLGSIRCKNGKYGIETTIHNEIKEAWMPFFREFSQPVVPDFIDLFIKLDLWAFDDIMTRFYNREDADFTAKLRVHFEEKVTSSDTVINTRHAYYGLMYRCGFTNIRGIAAKYFQNNKVDNPKQYFTALPGTHEYRVEEAYEVIRLMREGKLKCHFDLDEFAVWVENVFKRS